MTSRDKKFFNDQIDARLSDPQWSAFIAGKVMASADRQKSAAFRRAVSIFIPLASAALIFFVWNLSSKKFYDQDAAAVVELADVEIPELKGLISNEVDVLVSLY